MAEYNIHFQAALGGACLLALVLAPLWVALALRADAIAANPAEAERPRARSFARCVAFALLAAALAYWSVPTRADKNRAPAGGGALRTLPALVAHDIQEELLAAYTNDVTSLRFTGLFLGDTSIVARASWPAEGPPPGNALDVFAAHDVETNRWTLVGALATSAATNAVAFEMTYDIFPPDWLDRLFLRLGTMEDSDGDGIPDAEESLAVGTDPASADTDGDGMPDGWEVVNGLDPTDASDAGGDADGDGLTNAMECALGIDPNDPDTDGDGMCDGSEVEAGGNPLGADGVADLGPVETTQAEGPDFEIAGEYSVAVVYAGPYTDDFAVLGIGGPGGTTNAGSVAYEVGGPSWTNAFELTASGASFRPLKTGYFAFQAMADDLSEVCVGDVEFTSSWPSAVPGVETQAVMVAGREYPVSIWAGSVGGPARLAFPKWGEFTPVVKPRLLARFTKDAVIFEDAYTPRLGEAEVPRSSTRTMLRIGVDGGEFGGTLRISDAGMNRLLRVDGEAYPSSEIALAPNETRFWNGVYEGVLPSATTNDVAVVATFTENVTGETLVHTASVTSVRLTVEADADWPVNKRRKELGVGELATITVEPFLDGWTLTNTDPCSTLSGTGGVWDYEAGTNSCADEISILGLAALFSYAIHQPEGYISSLYSFSPNEIPNVAGNFAMHFDLTVCPTNVSFANVLIKEVGMTATDASGYFLEPAHTNLLVHVGETVDAWVEVTGENAIGDTVGCAPLAKPWGSGGHMVWPIPNRWRLKDDKQGDGVFMGNTDQRYELWPDGRVRMEKFGWFGESTTNLLHQTGVIQ